MGSGDSIWGKPATTELQHLSKQISNITTRLYEQGSDQIKHWMVLLHAAQHEIWIFYKKFYQRTEGKCHKQKCMSPVCVMESCFLRSTTSRFISFICSICSSRRWSSSLLRSSCTTAQGGSKKVSLGFCSCRYMFCAFVCVRPTA